MIPHGSSSLKEAILLARPANEDPDRINITEEAVKRAPTSENFGMVTETTSPCSSGTTQTMTTDGMQRDSQRVPHQLPDEILIEIIHCAASNPRIDPDTGMLSDPTLLESLTSYREVCRRWKILVDGTPSLWAFLSADDAPAVEAFQRMIENSGNASLVIVYGHAWMGLQYFVNMVAPQMHRCKALWIKTRRSDYLPTVQTLFSQPSPLLEELYFVPETWWGVQVDGVDSNTVQGGTGPTYFDIWALRHNAQRLEVVSLGEVTEWRTGSKLTNLRELKLSRPKICFKDLMESLAESPLLSNLIVDYSVWEMYRFSERATVVELAFLARIDVWHASASFTHSLLSHISPPSLRQLLIYIRDFKSPLFPLGDVGPGYQALFLSLIKAQGAKSIPIEVGVRYQRLFVADEQTGREFELSAEVSWPSGHLRYFVQSLSNISRHWSKMSTPSLALLFGTTDPDPRDKEIHLAQECLRALIDIEGVTKIQLGDMADSVEQVYQLLSDAVGDEEQPRRWLAPRLAILEIEGHQSLDTALVQMLEGRYATTTSANGDTLAPLPLSRLKLVRDPSEVPEPQIAEKIRSIIGEEHFRLEIYH